MRRLLLTATLALAAAAPLRAQAPEALWYATNDEPSVQSFLAHADRISVVAPQSFRLDSAGVITGAVDPRLLAAAREHRVRVVPLIVNPGFDQAMFHRVLVTPAVRATAVRNIAALCRDGRFDGIQFDFENIAVTDRDAFTTFARETAEALRPIGCPLSAAVVPRASEDRGPTPYHQWMFDNWRGAYDYKALADVMDFLSLMTYSQHTRRTPPGPVAGAPWMEASLAYLLRLGVPPAKISLGIPSYSQWWYATWDSAGGPRTTGRGMRYADVQALLTKHGASATWDERQQESYATWENDGLNEAMFVVDARAFAARLPMVARHRLRGYSVWVLGFEDPATWSAVGAVSR